MKAAIWIFVLLCIPLSLSSETPDEAVARIQAELKQHLNLRLDLQGQFKKYAQKEDDIKWAYEQYKKQSDVLEGQKNELKQRAQVLASKYEVLEPQKAALEAKFNEHNSHPCYYSEKNPHECDAYDAEAKQLKDAQAVLNAKYEPLNKSKQAIINEGDGLDKNGELLEQIRQNVSNQTFAWAQDVKHLKGNWDDNEAAITRLQTELAHAKDECIKSIPAYCDKPDNPNLNAKCERMHAACGRAFDGN
jgi:chromosome segregation ATPase